MVPGINRSFSERKLAACLRESPPPPPPPPKKKKKERKKKRKEEEKDETKKRKTDTFRTHAVSVQAELGRNVSFITKTIL